MDNCLELRQIYKTYLAGEKKQLALQAINLSLEPGKCLGLIGKSGCGKTTLLKLIARLINADSGEIYWQGENITTWRKKKLRPFYNDLRFIGQNPLAAFNPRRTISWSIGERLRANNYSSRDVINRIQEVLAMVKLPAAYADFYPHELSGGECQRAAIARALVIKPKLLLCDEVTSALDKTNKVSITKLLRKLVTEQNVSCLFVTHNINSLQDMADMIAVMDNGQIVEYGTAARIMENPQSAAAKALVTAAKILK